MTRKNRGPIVYMPTVQEVLNDSKASTWLKDALRSALNRDPMDAANDAAFLASLLRQAMLDSLGK